MDCHKCDVLHMQQAGKMKEPYLYSCHAGIHEIIAPLHLGEKTIGYLFFSHILAYSSYEEAEDNILPKARMYLADFDPETEKSLIRKMPLVSKEYLRAAARLLDETASYLIYNHMAYLQYESLSSRIDRYIKEHLCDDVSPKKLCEVFSIGKTYLYQLTDKLYGEGLSEHVRKMRINKAMELMREKGNIKISAIASEVGFDDYSYFIVVFKKLNGMTPKQFIASLRE